LTLAFAAYLACLTPAQALSPVPSPVVLQRVDRQSLCVTNGDVASLSGGRLAIDTPSSRAVVRWSTAQTAEIRFRYLGPSETSKPLASGELRRQIGIKLRAQDTCNLVYVMWHIAPDARIAVSVKRNPGKHSHAECGATGYVNIRPWREAAAPKLQPNESHVLRAELSGEEVTVTADGMVVWGGSLGNGIATMDGPVGFRTDNARFELEYFTAATDSGTPPNSSNRCQKSPGD
jgi:hypothetical protein